MSLAGSKFPSGPQVSGGAGGGSVSFGFRMDTTGTVAPPVDMGLRTNNATQNLATEWYLDTTAGDGADVHEKMLQLIEPGDKLVASDSNDSTIWQLVKVKTITDNTTYITLELDQGDTLSNGGNISDEFDISISIRDASPDGDGDGDSEVAEFVLSVGGGANRGLIIGQKKTDAGGALNTVGDDAIQILSGATDNTNIASGDNAIAIGNNVTASGANAIAMGSDALVANGTLATEEETIAIGNNCGARAARGIRMGANGSNLAIDGVCFGGNTDVTVGGVGAIAIGSDSVQGARASGVGCIAIGGDNGANPAAFADGANSIAIGSGANFNSANGIRSIAIGFNCEARGSDCNAIGSGCRAFQASTHFFGNNIIDFGTAVTGQKVGIGGFCQVEDKSVCIGHNSQTQSENSIAIGNSTNATNAAKVLANSNGGIAIGGGGVASTSLAARVINAVCGIAMGSSNGVLDGANINTAGAGSIAFGGTNGTERGPRVTANNAYAIGAGVEVDVEDTWQIRGFGSAPAAGAVVDWERLAGTQITLVSPVIDALTINAGTTQTSGALIVGNLYEITTFVAGDNFLNVGADTNVTGTTFIATGTTPTDYTNGSTLTLLATLDNHFTFPANVHFDLDSIDWKILAITGTVGTQPTIRSGDAQEGTVALGTTADAEKYVAAAVGSNLNKLFGRDVKSAPSDRTGTLSLSSGVTSAATTATVLDIRIAYKGTLYRNE